MPKPKRSYRAAFWPLSNPTEPRAVQGKAEVLREGPALGP